MLDQVPIEAVKIYRDMGYLFLISSVRSASLLAAS
jgi:hypothetical protein